MTSYWFPCPLLGQSIRSSKPPDIKIILFRFRISLSHLSRCISINQSLPQPYIKNYTYSLQLDFSQIDKVLISYLYMSILIRRQLTGRTEKAGILICVSMVTLGVKKSQGGENFRRKEGKLKPEGKSNSKSKKMHRIGFYLVAIQPQYVLVK